MMKSEIRRPKSESQHFRTPCWWGGIPLLIFALIFSGCASAPTSRRADDEPQAQGQIRRRLEQILDACEKKDLERLDSYHLYGPKFTKFASESPDRQDAETARKGEHDGLGAVTGLAMKADNLRIDLFGNVAVATFVLNYSFKVGTNATAKSARTTLIFVKERDGWKIAHEHLSALKAGP